MITRRRFGWLTLAGMTSPLVSCGALVADSAFPVPAGLAALVDALEQASTRRHAQQAAGDHLVAGGTVDELYRALMLACCRQLTFDPLGFAAHPMWMIESARELGDRGTAADRVLAALHVVDLFKLEQGVLRGDERPGPGVLGALPDPDPVALEAAVHDGDADGADAAAVALLRTGDLDACRAALARCGLHSVGSIGHVQVHTAQILRSLDAWGWDESVVRCFAWGLAREAASEYAVLGPWEANQALAESLPDGWDAGGADPAGARALLAALRTDDPEASSTAVADALAGGLGLGSVLDALGMRASELSLSHVGHDGLIAGIHAHTGLDGFRWILATGDDAARRRAILQAAALIAVNDAEAAERSGSFDPVTLDELEPVEGGSAAAILDTAAHDRLDAVRQLLAFVAAQGVAPFMTAQLAVAQDKTVEEHQFKLPAAAWAAAEAADPSLAGAVLAGTLAFGPTAADPDWDLADEAREIADRVG